MKLNRVAALRPRYLKCPGTEVMVRYEKGIVHYIQDASLLLQNPLYPGRAMMDSWLDQVPKDALRWHVNTRPSAPRLKKSVLRSALQGKWYKLMCQALEQHGYRTDGRLTETGERGLAGTLEIIVQLGDRTMHEPEPELLQRCSKIVQAVEEQQKKDRSKRMR